MDGRRQFIKKVFGFTAVFGIWLSPLFRMVGSAYAQAQSLVAAVKSRATDAWATALDRFGTMGVVTYDADLKTWRLEISGNVKHPLKLTYDQLLEFPTVEKEVALVCPGFFINNGLWKGVSMKPLLEKAEVADDAAKVIITGHNGNWTKTEEFPIADILSNKVFFAHTVNGVTLPEKHGYPLRVVAEGRTGDDWVKYVYSMKVV
jgi:DMSO/TMAO reductase YedYZ molybdopterin-dependent catalytic subunit